MRLIIAGSRQIRLTIRDMDRIVRESGFGRPTEVICGEGGAVDRAGKAWARAHEVPVISLPAEWARHGRAAGPMRNQQMARRADALIAVWDGASRGTADMIARARESGLRVHVNLDHEPGCVQCGKSTAGESPRWCLIWGPAGKKGKRARVCRKCKELLGKYV